jgi:hypothetical protein
LARLSLQANFEYLVKNRFLCEGGFIFSKFPHFSYIYSLLSLIIYFFVAYLFPKEYKRQIISISIIFVSENRKEIFELTGIEVEGFDLMLENFFVY